MKTKWPGSGKDLPLIPRCNNLDKEKRMRLQKKGRTVFPRKRILTIRRTVLLTVTRMPGVTRPDYYKNARSCTRSSPSSTGNRRGDIGSSDSNSEGDNRGQRVSPQPRPDYYKNARSDTRSPASSGQETSAHERPGQPDAKLDHTHHCLLVTLANSNLKVNYRTTWKRHIQLRILMAK